MFPSTEFILSDDQQVRAILLHLGVLNDFSEDCGFSGERLLLRTYKNHASHWLLAVRFSGFSVPSENGFILHGWPKGDFPESVLVFHLDQYKRNHARFVIDERRVRSGGEKN